MLSKLKFFVWAPLLPTPSLIVIETDLELIVTLSLNLPSTRIVAVSHKIWLLPVLVRHHLERAKRCYPFHALVRGSETLTSSFKPLLGIYWIGHDSGPWWERRKTGGWQLVW